MIEFEKIEKICNSMKELLKLARTLPRLLKSACNFSRYA